MGDTGSEGSEAPRCQPRCRCGFWGSTKTMNLCSKCFADYLKSRDGEGSSSMAPTLGDGGASDSSALPTELQGSPNLPCRGGTACAPQLATVTDVADAPASPAGASITATATAETTHAQPCAQLQPCPAPKPCEGASTASEEATGAAPSSLPAPSSRLLAPVAEIALISSAELERVSPPREPQPAPSREPEAGSSTSMSPSSRSTNQDSRETESPVSRLRDIPLKRLHDPDGVDGESGSDSPAKKTCGDKDEDEEEKGRAKQKNKRRCFTCRARLELVQQELGLCRCGFVFCSLHRLPEQHACTYDHMGHGRQEALQKMVKLDKKVGRSFHRIGEECC
ncbi:AN1-type zinc finger protein 3 [Lampetra fluviatilis]